MRDDATRMDWGVRIAHSFGSSIWLTAALATVLACDAHDGGSTASAGLDNNPSSYGSDQGGDDDDQGDDDDFCDSGGAVPTSRNNNARTGANLCETKLTPSKVNVNSFGLLYTRNLLGKVYAQPLFVPGVKVRGHGKVDIVYVVTEHNMVYAFDANDVTGDGTPLWSRNLGPTVPSEDVNVPGRSCLDITPEIGISSAPVIDLGNKTMYVIAKVEENGVQNHRIFALDIATGATLQTPVDIAATFPGTASDSVNGVLTFDPVRHNIRAGLLLHQGILYVAAAAHCDFPPWHGWLFAYRASTLQLQAVLVTTPDGAGGGVWQSGGGLSADKSGVYFVAGNGTYEDGTIKPQSGFGQTIGRLRLDNHQLTVLDWFIPFNVDLQNFEDADLASPAMLVPNTNMVIALSRGGRVPLKQMADAYVLQRNNFGHFHASQADELAQTVLLSDPDDTADPTNSLLQRAYALVHFRGPHDARIFSWAQNDFPRAFAIQGNALNPVPVATGTAIANSATVTGMISLSANGTRNGILWGSINVDNADKNAAKTQLFAFDAQTLQTLWDSRQNQARDEVGTWGKWAYPTIAGGKVFLANADAQLKVYGLLH